MGSTRNSIAIGNSSLSVAGYRQGRALLLSGCFMADKGSECQEYWEEAGAIYAVGPNLVPDQNIRPKTSGHLTVFCGLVLPNTCVRTEAQRDGRCNAEHLTLGGTPTLSSGPRFYAVHRGAGSLSQVGLTRARSPSLEHQS